MDEKVHEDLYKKQVIDPGDRASECGMDVCVGSYENNSAVEIIPRQPGNFRGAVDMKWSDHVLSEMLGSRMFSTVQNDGAGQKPQFFAAIGTDEVFRNLGWEIVVMVIDDIARTGGYPVVFSNDVNVKYVTDDNYHLVKSMFAGMSDILKRSNLVNITGEFAIMQQGVSSFCDKNSEDQLILNWAGTGIGLSSHDRIIDGSKVLMDMPIVGFWEPGYRCNGGTQFIRQILAKWAKNDIRDIWENPEAMAFIKKLTTPSLSYANTISRINGWLPGGYVREPLARMNSVVHVTGGGFGKLKESLPSGIGAYLHNMPVPAKVLLEAQEMSFEFPDLEISDRKAHTTLHGGCGMVTVCGSNADAEVVIAEAGRDGIQAQIVGTTIPCESNLVHIDSKFLQGSKVVI